MKIFVGIVGGLLILVGLFSLAFGLEWLGIQWKGYFGPKHAAVERKVFKETRSYNEGKVQELTKYHHEYVMAKTREDKLAIASVVRQAFAEYDETKIESPLLRNWLIQVKNDSLP